MKKYYIPIIVFLLYSCSQTKQGDLFEISVDINQDSSVPLSEIAEEITAIELELTDESLINPEAVFVRILMTEDNIILAEGDIGPPSQVLVFNKDGTFVRTIGSRGQGPGEFNTITTVAFDDKSKRLFILNWGPRKIIVYHLDGKFLKETRLNQNGIYRDINYINDGLFLEYTDVTEVKIAKSILYRLNDNLQVTDSIIYWENYYEQNYNGTLMFADFIIKRNTSVYFYSSEVYPKKYAPNIKVLRDTLYRLEKNQLVPELKLKFKNDGIDGFGDKITDLYNIFRSSRYVFAIYKINPNNRAGYTEITNWYHFCYDTKTGKSYNMQDGYTDDIHGIEKRVMIRPLSTNSEYFYYWYTHMKPDDLEEPNPTLYIGKFKN